MEQVSERLAAYPSKRLNQLKLLGIFAIAGVPVAAAMVMYFLGVGVPAGKTNKGDLLQPLLSAELLGRGQESNGTSGITRGEWVLLQTGSGICDRHCLDMAHTARQVNILMGREQDRVHRVFLTDQIERLPDSIRVDYPYLDIEPIEQDRLRSLYEASGLAPTDVETWHLWIVDPNGNIILRYGSEHSGYDLRDDLKKLLQLSNIG